MGGMHISSGGMGGMNGMHVGGNNGISGPVQVDRI